jgi:hypothetical protein
MHGYEACEMSTLVAKQKERVGGTEFVHVEDVCDTEGVIDLALV